MEILRLTPADCQLLSTRFAEHGNSLSVMRRALDEAGRHDDLERLRALRRMELHFRVDLGSLCHRFQLRDAPGTHPIETGVLDYVAQWRLADDGTPRLWVRIDRVRQIRQLMEEDELVREPEV